MTSNDDLTKRLRRIAKISYGATIEEAKDVSKALQEAADLIDQKDRDLAALKSDIEAQVQLALEATEVATRYQAVLESIRDRVNDLPSWRDERNMDWSRGRILAACEMALRGARGAGEGKLRGHRHGND